MRITLLQRPGQVSAREFATALEQELDQLKGDLSASIRLAGFSEMGWAMVDVTGDDAEIVSELIVRKLGRTLTEFSGIERFGNYEGIVTGEVGGNLEIDIGLEKPRQVAARLTCASLRAQLCDGRALPVEEIINQYCLFPTTKLGVRITNLESASGLVEGWLADSQLAEFANWISMRLDRIHVFDCSAREVDVAVRRANLGRDIVSVEHMTLTTHSIICKLGTDAIGLIPKLGSVLRRRGLKPFIPRRIISRCRQW